MGAAVSWHQDGTTHWESDDFDQNIHGFNFMAQVYGSNAVNGVWVLPGSHKLGKVDIKQLVKESGSERIDGTVPLICDPGGKGLLLPLFASENDLPKGCLLYTSPSPRDGLLSRMPSSA